jgi:hypothetical protein
MSGGPQWDSGQRRFAYVVLGILALALIGYLTYTAISPVPSFKN